MLSHCSQEPNNAFVDLMPTTIDACTLQLYVVYMLQQLKPSFNIVERLGRFGPKRLKLKKMYTVAGHLAVVGIGQEAILGLATASMAIIKKAMPSSSSAKAKKVAAGPSTRPAQLATTGAATTK